MNDRVEAALAAFPKATPGPWEHTNGIVWVPTHDNYGNTCQQKVAYAGTDDAPLIAAAPDLAAEVIRLREEVAKLKKALVTPCEEAKS